MYVEFMNDLVLLKNGLFWFGIVLWIMYKNNNILIKFLVGKEGRISVNYVDS